MLSLPDICSVSRPAIILSWWEEYKSYWVVYDSLPCRFYSGKQWLKSDNLSQQTETWNYKMIVEVGSDIVRGDFVWLDCDSYIVEEIRTLKTSVAHHKELNIKRL